MVICINYGYKQTTMSLQFIYTYVNNYNTYWSIATLLFSLFSLPKQDAATLLGVSAI